jgi:chaperone protein EcpD
MFGFNPQRATLRPAFGLCATLLMLATYLPAAQAALTVNTTRVVFSSDKRSASVIISNPSNLPFAVQTWVNTEADDATTAVPFIPSPPLFRLNPGKEQQLQINGLPNDLPSDRESLFYLNVQEIPQAASTEENVLSIALRTRIKLFYRPAQLKDNPVKRLKDVQWSIKQVAGKAQLVATNPTPFHISFIRLEVSGNAKTEQLKHPAMLGPLTTQTYPLDDIKVTPGLQVVFAAINDYGGYTSPLTVPLQLH